MRRGDLVTVALSGDFAKPRPTLVVQADAFEVTGTVTLLLLSTTTLVDAPLLRPSVPTVGSERPTQAVSGDGRQDHVGPARQDWLGLRPPGERRAAKVSRALAIFLGIA